MKGIIRIQPDRLIFQLLCIYAFLIPLEQILEIQFGIDTVFKPYRIVAIALILIMLLRSTKVLIENRDLREDLFLYLIFVYGVVITFYRMLDARFGLGHFYNDTFQMGLYLAVFIIIRHSYLNRDQITVIFGALIMGVLVNVFYIFYQFYFLRDFDRHSGFMDNPNYLALSLVIGILYLFLRFSLNAFWRYLAMFLMIPLILYVFIIAGSRTSVMVLLAGLMMLIWFSSWRRKFVILTAGLGCMFALGFGLVRGVEVEGPLILVNRLENTELSSDPRIPAWKGVMRASIQTNFIGLGIGQFKTRFYEFFYRENDPLIRRMISRGYFLSPHSDYFAILVTYGAIGLILYLVFLGQTFRKIVAKIRTCEDWRSLRDYRFSLVVLISLALFGLTAENFNSALYWILLSLSTKIA